MAVSVFGNNIVGAFTGGVPVKAIYTGSIKVWPIGPEPGEYYIDWTPTNMTGVFSIDGNNYYLQDYSGHFTDFSGIITTGAFSNINITTLDTNAIRVGYEAFKRCSSLKTASLSKCSYLGPSTFALCINLSSVSLPVCSHIGSRAFYDDVYLSTISLPEATYIGQSAFASCARLRQVYLGPYCSMVEASAFYSVGYSLSGYTTYILAYRGEGTVGITPYNLGSLVVPAWKMNLYSSWVSSVWRLSGQYYVKYYKNNVLIDKEYRDNGGACSASIGSTSYFETDATAIYSDTNLGSTLLRASLSQVRTIGTDAFINCQNLSDFFAPNVKVIGYNALKGTALPYITLPVCYSIYNSAFKDCKSLSYVMLGSKSVASMIGGYIFSGCDNLQYIFVRSSLVTAYKSASMWSRYSDLIYPIPS